MTTPFFLATKPALLCGRRTERKITQQTGISTQPETSENEHFHLLMFWIWVLETLITRLLCGQIPQWGDCYSTLRGQRSCCFRS